VADQSERTAREREEARLERERRRVQRLGQTTSEQLAVSGEGQGRDRKAPAAGARDGERETPAADARDGERKTPAADAPDGDRNAPRASPQNRNRQASPASPQSRGGEAPAADPRDGHDKVRADDPQDWTAPDPNGYGQQYSYAPESEELIDEPTGDHEVPLGIRRATYRDRLRAPGRRTRPRLAGRRNRPPATRRRDNSQPPQRRSWAGRAISIVALALGVVVLWFLLELFQPFHGQGHGSVTVTIPAHSGASQIGTQLERDGVISSSFFFNLRAMLAGDRGSLLSGTYRLRQDMSYGDVLRVLSTPPPAAKTTNVTIIEGRTLRQVDALLRSQGVPGSYLAATRRSLLLDPRRYGAPAATASLEGFLFPSTYQLLDPIRISALVSDQLTTFKREFATVNLSYARSRHLSVYDVLIIASIVEKEAGTAHDFPLVASVIYNRLAMQMPLGMDSTIRYEFNDYTKRLTQSQLSASSPYNTRLHPGLPPTPIANPGLAAIEAAAHPARTNYLYFVAKPCGNGASAFTGSYSQFLVYQQRYRLALTRRSGKSLTHC
jgi:UPF0755 protein